MRATISSASAAIRVSIGRYQRIVEQARSYGIRNLIPVDSNKIALERWGHFQTREKTAEEYAQEFNQHPECNAANLTGEINGFFVADCDSVEAVEYFEKRGHDETWTVRSREGRLHFYFRHPGFRVRNNNTGKIFEHLDIKGDGAYVIAVGSVHASGFIYCWDPGHSPADLELAEAPSWLLELLKPPPERPAEAPRPFSGTISNYARAARDQELARVAAAPEGQRNQTLNDVAFSLGQLVGGGELDATDIASALHAIANQWPNASHSCGTVNRALVAGMESPRSRPNNRSKIYMNGTAGAHANGDAGKSTNGQQNANSEAAADATASDIPGPLPSDLPSVPAFDADLLPQPLRPWLTDIADRAQAPIEFAAVTTIVELGSVIGRHLGIYPKRYDDWLVVPNTWGIAIGPPGILKSPMINEALKALKRLEDGAREDYQHEYEAYELEKEAAEGEREKIKRRVAAKNSMLSRSAAVGALRDLTVKPPVRRRYVVNDPTVEALGPILNENPAGLLLQRDELSGWLKTMDRQGHENDRAFYLQCWNGYGPYDYDRIVRGNLHIDATCMSIVGSMTPGPLGAYLREVFSGNEDDGMIQRFQLAVYPDCCGWKNVDREPDREARQRVFDLFEQLAGFRADPTEGDEIPALRFDDEAQQFFDDFRTNLEARVRNPDDHPVMLAHLSKYRSLMPSLALIFHACETNTNVLAVTRVTLRAAQMAAGWCYLLEAHARRIYYSVTASVDFAVRIIGGRIKARKLPTPFTARDVYRASWGGIGDRENVTLALEVLEELHWIQGEVVPATSLGGRPTVRYHINERVWG